jgi:hypothetical protein
MKNILALLVFIGVCANASACSVRVISASPEVNRAMPKKPLDFKNYTAICQRLNAENAGLLIMGDAGVLEGNSIAWAVVSLQDKNVSIFTSMASGSATRIGQQGTMDEAQAMLHQVIGDSVDRMDIEKAIAALNHARALIKSAKK